MPSPIPGPGRVVLGIPIAKKLGCPFVIHPLWPGLAWRDRRLVSGNNPDTEMTEERNHCLESMNPALWQMMPASLAVAREDREPPHVAHVHALKPYCVELGYRWDGMLPNSDDINPLREIVPEVDTILQAKADYMLEKANKQDFLVAWDEHMRDSGREKYGDVARMLYGWMMARVVDE